MVDLKCKLINCAFNKNSNCTAKEISVAPNADCKSYTPQNVTATEKDQLPMPLVRSNIDVNCRAECLFRKQGKCIANGITVCDETGSKNAASCSTFMPR